MSDRRRHALGQRAPVWPFAVNWASPLAEGLVHYFVPYPGAPNAGMLDLVRGIVMNPVGTPTASVLADINLPAPVTGSGNYMEGPDGNTLAVGNTVMSAVAWIRPSAGTRGDIAAHWAGSGDRKFDLLQGVTTGKFQFFVSPDGVTLSNSGVSTTTIVAGTEYMVAGITDGGTVYIAVNGVIENSSGGPATLVSPTSIPFRIGESGIGTPFPGEIGHVLLYNVPLSAERVWGLYDPATRWSILRAPRPSRMRARGITAAAGGDPEGSLIAGKLLRGGILTHGVLTR